MTIRAVSNQKGGVGKTTTVITLAGLMLERGRRQLLVDLDPHCSLTSYLRQDPEEMSGGAFALFHEASEQSEAQPHKHVRRVPEAGLDILLATPALATVERRFGSRLGMGLVIANAMKSLAHTYDDIWIDCPPTLGLLMINSLAACEQLLIPVQTDFLALKGLERMYSSLPLVERSRGMKIPRLVLPTFYDRRTRASIDTLESLRQNYSDELWNKPIPVDTAFRYASERGRPLSQLRSNSRGVAAYRELSDHLLEHEGREALAS